MVSNHAYFDLVRLALNSLDALNRRLSGSAGLVNKISAEKGKDDSPPGKVGTAIRDWVAQVERQALTISIFKNAHNSSAFEPNAGEVEVHVA
jgi:hypothetical protein